MPIRTEIIKDNHIYHIYTRSLDSRTVFKEKTHRIRFLDLLYYYNDIEPKPSYSAICKFNQIERQEVINRRRNPNADILLYCIMKNHFHVVLRPIKGGNISLYISNLLNSTTRFYNICNDRVGNIFQTPYKCKLVNDLDYYAHLHRYIHLNPWSGGLVQKLEDCESYYGSSYAEYLNNSIQKIITDKSFLENFKSVQKYKEFINNRGEYQKSLEIIKQSNPGG